MLCSTVYFVNKSKFFKLESMQSVTDQTSRLKSIVCAWLIRHLDVDGTTLVKMENIVSGDPSIYRGNKTLRVFLFSLVINLTKKGHTSNILQVLWQNCRQTG